MAKVLLIASLAESLINFRGDLIREMLRCGHTVHTVAPIGPAWVDDILGKWGVQHHVVDLQRAGLNPLKDLAYLRRLIQLCRAERPDVLLAYTVKPVVYGALAGRWCRVPTVATMVTGLGFAFMPVSGWRHALTRSAAWLLYKAALACAHQVFFQNPDDKADFGRLRLFNARLKIDIVNGSGINLERFPCLPLPQDGPRRVLLIARLLVDKGIREYIAAAQTVKARHPDVQFDLVGPFDPNPAGIAKAEIDQAVRDGTVNYFGSQNDVRPMLGACHVYALPSYREGTPRSILEAMATGRPVVTTDAPGCRETVIDGINGRLVAPRSAQALARAIEELLAMDFSALQALGCSSRQMAEQKYDVHRVNQQLMAPLGLCDEPARP